MKDPKERFTETAELYDKYRPSYPPELIAWVAEGLEANARAADIGCGTGISARLFAGRGFHVIGVDPNEAMLDKARKKGGPFQHGTSDKTGLPPASQDLVFAAQAFHWFDIPSTLAEWRRILKPGGRAAAFWNDRTQETEFLKEYEALLEKSSAEYRELTRRRSTLDELRAAAGVCAWEEASFPWVQAFDRDSLFGRVFSSSYVMHGLDDRAAFERDLDDLFARRAQKGLVEFRYRAVGARWRLP